MNPFNTTPLILVKGLVCLSLAIDNGLVATPYKIERQVFCEGFKAAMSSRDATRTNDQYLHSQSPSN
jgi:hypothetical protein